MITIQNVKTLLGDVKDIQIESEEEGIVDGEGRLLALPALIDPHVHFLSGENWKSGARAALSGGITTVFDMPNSEPPCLDKESFHTKKAAIKTQLAEAQIPLRYRLFIGANANNLEGIGKVKKETIGIHVYLGSRFGKLGKHDDRMLDRVFQIAGQDDLVVAVATSDREDTEHVLAAAEKYSSQLYLLNIHTEEELAMIHDARRHGILTYAEATPQHLFPTDSSPSEALWEALRDGTIDSIGSGHVPQQNSPFGVPALETLLPLLLNACQQNRITLERIVELTHHNLKEIYRLETNDDVVLVDLDKEQAVQGSALQTQCKWSPYEGSVLKGWPVYTILKGRIYPVNPWS